MKVSRRLWLPAAAGLGLLALTTDSHAESINRAKGLAGGAMLGAEVVLVSEAALGVKPGWAYLVGGAAGGGAGALGGYYLGGGSSPKPSSFLLAGGIALVIPTMIAVAAATSFNPPEHYQRDAAPEDELDLQYEEDEEPSAPADEPPTARLELPAVEVARAFSAEELQKFGARQVTEVHVALLRGSF